MQKFKLNYKNDSENEKKRKENIEGYFPKTWFGERKIIFYFLFFSQSTHQR